MNSVPKILIKHSVNSTINKNQNYKKFYQQKTKKYWVNPCPRKD